MPTFDVAHITHQGCDLIIVPMHANFPFRTPREQKETVAGLQRAAVSTGWTGTVVPIWDSGGGRMAFLAPTSFQVFLHSIDLGFVAENINDNLTL